MKTLKELQAIREAMKSNIAGRDSAGDKDARVVIGMATCGIAAGARDVLRAFSLEITRQKLKNVVLTQTGCMGICSLEPIVEVFLPGKEKVTYIKVDVDKVKAIVSEHIIGGMPVEEFMYADQKIEE